MGVHYVNGGLVGDGVVDEQHPEALVYEPKSNNHLELVAVEFIVLASQWDAAHTDNLPPTLRGQVFQFNSAPNRYRLPAFYELPRVDGARQSERHVCRLEPERVVQPVRAVVAVFTDARNDDGHTWVLAQLKLRPTTVTRGAR